MGGDFHQKRIGFVINLCFYFALLFWFFFSTIYACRKLSGPGMCAEVRQLVLKRHIITIAVYIIAYFYVFLDFFYIAFQLESTDL